MTRIDLRSDTVTHPTPRMRAAMATAEVGDDSYRDDPTVNHLQEMAADLLGKEDALFVASGTMGNLTALLTYAQGRRGGEIILGDEAHILHHESGGYASVAGLAVRTVPNGRGCPDPADVEAAIRSDSPVGLYTALIALENTHNRCGGTVITLGEMLEIRTVARQHGLPVHLDGARMFNAAVALNLPPGDIAGTADSVSFCFSKGLSAPVGSILLGSRAFIDAARRNRKLLGGGMRQVGVLAAAAIVALEDMIPRLAEDHANACLFAERVSDLPGIKLELSTVQSNIVRFHYSGPNPDRFMGACAGQGLLLTGSVREGLRAVTHYGIEQSDVLRAVETLAAVISDLAGLSVSVRA